MGLFLPFLCSEAYLPVARSVSPAPSAATLSVTGVASDTESAAVTVTAGAGSGGSGQGAASESPSTTVTVASTLVPTPMLIQPGSRSGELRSPDIAEFPMRNRGMRIFVSHCSGLYSHSSLRLNIVLSILSMEKHSGALTPLTMLSGTTDQTDVEFTDVAVAGAHATGTSQVPVRTTSPLSFGDARNADDDEIPRVESTIMTSDYFALHDSRGDGGAASPRSHNSSASAGSSVVLALHPQRDTLRALDEGAMTEDRVAMAQSLLLEFEAALDAADEDFVLTRGIIPLCTLFME